jgi:hypothetical protein
MFLFFLFFFSGISGFWDWLLVQAGGLGISGTFGVEIW